MIPGLHIRIRPRSVTWRLVKRFGAGEERKQRYWDIGEVGRTPEAVARERANEALKLIDRGMDPETYLRNVQRGGVHVDEAGWSFGTMLDTYLASTTPKHPEDPANSYREYRSAFKVLDREKGIDGLKELDLRARPAAEITEFEIEHIRDVYGRIAPRRAGKLVSYISQAFNYAMEHKGTSKVLKNPAKYVSRDVPLRSRQTLLQKSQSAASGDRFGGALTATTMAAVSPSTNCATTLGRSPTWMASLSRSGWH